MSVTEAPKAVVIGISSQKIADVLAAIDTTLQSARKRQRDADDEEATIEFREQQLRQQLQELSEYIVSYGSQLIPIAERIARTLVSAVVTRQVPINESWEAAALFCAYFPSAGASILTEVFEQYLESNTVWMPTLMGNQYLTITPRLEAVADMITASIVYVETSLAQRFASLFTSEATDIAIWRRSHAVGGQTVLVLPHAVNCVFTALLMNLRPCPPSVVAECTDRLSGIRGHSYSVHTVYPKPVVAANKAPNLQVGGAVGGVLSNSDSFQLTPLPLPFLGAYKLAQESSVKLRAALSQVLHPRSQPFYQPPTTTVVDVWPVASTQTVAAAAPVATEAYVPPVVVSAPAAETVVAPVSSAASHPAVGGVTAPAPAPKPVAAPVATPVANNINTAALPKQQGVTGPTKAATVSAPSMKIEDLPDIEL